VIPLGKRIFLGGDAEGGYRFALAPPPRWLADGKIEANLGGCLLCR